MRRAELILNSRANLKPKKQLHDGVAEAEGGCGVTGFACTIPVKGKHIYEPSAQMRNRGNGKGGGIAACGLVPEDMLVSKEVLERDYIFQVAILDPKVKQQVEEEFIEPCFEIDQAYIAPTLDDFRDAPLLEVKPPDVARYFVRVKGNVLDRFAEENDLKSLAKVDLEDEFVYRNSFKLNRKFYSAYEEKQAFVVSHSKNLVIMKIVGFAEAAVSYYRMEDFHSNIWIAHQRYPTKGRVWHPAGAHPFVGMNEALVHNGDFANYHAVSEYLEQRNIFPQFLTDTEVSVLLFDLMNRVYGYPLEYIIEALAPTSELDFDRLSSQKQKIYRAIQASHLHASPDGPWFFIIARSLTKSKELQLVGITDTSMLRPQVFALQEGDVSIGLICSEKQAIDATLSSLAQDDKRFTPLADKYWNARGGSQTDGGAFLMTLSPENGAAGSYKMKVTNKFGDEVSVPKGRVHCDLSTPIIDHGNLDQDFAEIDKAVDSKDSKILYRHFREAVETMDFNRLRLTVDETVKRTAESSPEVGIECLTSFLDRSYPTGNKKRSSILTIIRNGLGAIFDKQPLLSEQTVAKIRRIGIESKDELRSPTSDEKILLINAARFAPEGDGCDSTLAIRAYHLGWKHIVHYNSKGSRFHGAGFGPATGDLRIDCYDNPGDYLASGMDGLEIQVHGNAQDQVGQITKSGKLVVHGDVGQTFLYGAKGGEFYVKGNAAGRPLINAVGKPRVVINGTALDFLAESFMAGDPLNGGGFVIVNGLGVDDDGDVFNLDMPFAGGNLLSLASGGAIYIRDPKHTLVEEQLNEGEYLPFTDEDWKLIQPYLEENERLFGIDINNDLLTVDGALRKHGEVYRKVAPKNINKKSAEKKNG